MTDKADEIAREIIAGSHVEFAEHYAGELVQAIAAALRSYRNEALEEVRTQLKNYSGTHWRRELADVVRSLKSKEPQG